MPKPVTLEAVKAEPKLKDMALMKYSRLSVQPVTDDEWKLICKMGGTCQNQPPCMMAQEPGGRTMMANINYLSILIAGVAAWLFGAVYYTALSGPWMAAQGKTMEHCKAEMAGKSKLADVSAVRAGLCRLADHGLGALRRAGASQDIQRCAPE